MGAKEITVLLMVFFSFCSSSSSSSSLVPLSKTFSSVRLQENQVRDEKINKNIKFAHGNSGRVVNGGGSAGKGNNGNNGGTKSPYVPGGTAVIPLYAAGAAGSHRNNHHSAGVRNQSCIGLPTFAAAILALFLVHTYVVF